MPPDTVSRYEVRIVRCGESYVCRADQSLLAAMEAMGRRGIPVGCRGGGCGACKIHVRSGAYRAGKMSRACVSDAEREQGIALACRTYPLSDVEVEAIGAMARRLAAP